MKNFLKRGENGEIGEIGKREYREHPPISTLFKKQYF